MTQFARRLSSVIPRHLAHAESVPATTRNQNLKKTWNFATIANLVLGLYIAGTFIVAFRMNCVDRSLWVDESMLAWSFSQRSIFTLTDGPFEYLQSAPVLYLYIVKLFTLVFGNTEFVLRLPSFIFYVLVVFLAYRMLKDGYQASAPVPLAGAACVSSAIILMRYASEFKQYMFEALVVMLLWYLYLRWIRGKSLAPLAIALPIAVWGANPACFFGGCICLYELIRGLVTRDKVRALQALAMGCLLVLGFIAYYFYWLKPAVGTMQGWWDGTEFPLNWLDVSELKRGIKLIQSMFTDAFNTAGAWTLVPLATAGLVLFSFCGRATQHEPQNGPCKDDSVSLHANRQHITRVIALSLLLMLVASGFSFFPLASRLWLFSCPIAIVLAFAIIGVFWDSASAVSLKLLVAIVAAIAIAASSGVPSYLHKEKIYQSHYEVNPNIAYLQQNVSPDESVYVWYCSVPVFQYKNGYGNTSIGAGQNNVIFGTTSWDDGSEGARKSGYIFGSPTQVQGVAGQEIDDIVRFDKCWMLLSHQYRTETFNAAMISTGYTELVLDSYGTPLYFHFQDPADAKERCTYELVSAKTNGNVCVASIRITNAGQTQIGNGLSTLYLSEESGSGTPIAVKRLAPGESREVLIAFVWNGLDSASFGLEQKDQYRLSELGINPITITRPDSK